MRRLLRWYGAGPLHLLALVAGFALAGYAALQLVPSRPLGVAVWFLGAVIGHDLLLMPLYSLADRSVLAVIRHRAPGLPAIGWINYVRVPAALSGLLLLIWFPLILRLTTAYQASTTLSPAPYLWHWLAVTGALFLLSAAALAVRLRRAPQAAPAPAEEDQFPAEQDFPGARSAPEGTARGAGPIDVPEVAAVPDGPGAEQETPRAGPEPGTGGSPAPRPSGAAATAPGTNTGRGTDAERGANLAPETDATGGRCAVPGTGAERGRDAARETDGAPGTGAVPGMPTAPGLAPQPAAGDDGEGDAAPAVN